MLSDVELAKLSYGGDNDGLASKIAITIGATELLLLSNVDGLLDESGTVVPIAKLSDIDKALGLANGKSDSGRGGMRSKIELSVVASQTGVKVCIGNASADYILLLSNSVGTHVH